MKVLLVVFLVLVSTAGAVLSAEFYLRSKTGQEIANTKCRTSDSVFHHVLIPNSECPQVNSEYSVNYKINSLGMRDKELELTKPKGTFRILMLGDSFTEGGGVELEKSFTKLLESDLKEKYQNVEVLNAGVGSYSPALYYAYLKLKGVEMKPDLVIINYDQTDFYDDLVYEEWFTSTYPEAALGQLGLNEELSYLTPAIQKAYESIQKPLEPKIKEKINKNPGFFVPFLPDQFEQYLLNNSQVWRLLTKTYLQGSGQYFTYGLEKEGNYVYNQIIPGSLTTDILIHTREMDLPNYKNWFAVTERNLLLTKQMLNFYQIPFIISVYPHGHQVDGYEWEEGRKTHFYEPGKVYSTRLFDSLNELGERKNIPVIDSLADFRASLQKPLFYNFDGHFTENGHRLMADVLYRYIMSNQLLD